MANRYAPWNWIEPVVNREGKATPAFLAWLQQALTTFQIANDAVPQARTINAGTALTGGGDLTVDRTISHADSAVTPDTYGDASNIPQITVDQQGHVTGVTSVPVDIPAALTVDQEGTTVATDVDTLNFTGSAVTVTDDGAGQVTVDITGGGGSTLYPGWAVQATGTGSSQTITLPVDGLITSQVLVFVNGLRYMLSEYSIVGDQLTLTTNASGDAIEIVGEISSSLNPVLTPHRAWRVRVTGTFGGWSAVGGIEFRQVSGTPELPTGGTAFSTTPWGGYAGVTTNVFDGSGIGMVTNGSSLGTYGYLYAAPIPCAQLSLQANPTYYSSEGPYSFVLEWSDDTTNGSDGTWTAVFANPTSTSWFSGEVRLFPISY